jgi:hypothetical protein
VNPRNNQYKTFAPLASGPAFPGSLDLDLATGFEKTATLAAGTASRYEGGISLFWFPEKARAFLLFRLLFSTFRFDNPHFGGWPWGTRYRGRSGSTL